MTSHQESRRSTPTVAGATLQGLTSNTLQDLMPQLIENLFDLPFESRKHVPVVFNYLLISGLEGPDPDPYEPAMERFRAYVESRYERLTVIVNGHELHGASDVCLHYGTMYRSCLRHPSLYRQLVGTMERVQYYVFPFLDLCARLPNFDVSSGALESLRIIFTAGGDRVVDEESMQQMSEIAADNFFRDYEAVWGLRFKPKLLSAIYMTRRVALQILSTVLLTRSNNSVLIRYADELAIRHGLASPHIALDAFHVFKKSLWPIRTKCRILPRFCAKIR
jgi:Mo25-like